MMKALTYSTIALAALSIFSVNANDAPPNSYIKNLTVHKLGDGIIYANDTMTAEVSVGYEVADGYFALLMGTGFYRLNTENSINQYNWFSEDRDNGYAHQINNSYRASVNKSHNSQKSTSYAYYYIGAKNNTFGEMQMCIRSSFIIFNASDASIVDDNVYATTCDNVTSDASIALKSIAPQHLTENSFYFNDYINERDNGLVRLDYRELYKNAETPEIREMKSGLSWNWNYPELDENGAMLGRYDVHNDAVSWVGTYFMGNEKKNYKYVYEINKNAVADASVPNNTSQDYVGTFLNLKLKHTAVMQYEKTCKPIYAPHQEYYCVSSETGDLTQRFGIHFPSSTLQEVITMTDMYGTKSDVTFKYDNDFMITLSDHNE